MQEEEIKDAVRQGYARIAKEGSCCGSGCCGGGDSLRASKLISSRIGYSDKDLDEVPDGANLGLGCGNPVALASLKDGEVVLDLGSGAGFDCFLAANRVGKKGKVIGIDMTPEMISRARGNARKGGYSNVEFRLGEIEALPVADGSVDAIISNCVINLAPDKSRVFKEAFRALRPGGRLMVSDIVLLKELPDAVKNSIEAYIGCLSGAIMKDRYLKAIKDAGFRKVKVVDETSYPVDDMFNDPTARTIADSLPVSEEEVRAIAGSITSAKVYAVKPG